jgi:methionyl-tRNA formyltransferase
MVNLHFSLLPRWRGAAPVERAILAGDARTGVDLMDVEEGLDTGGIHREVVVDIDPDETAEELRARLVEVGTRLLVDGLAEGLGEARPQEGEPTYAEKIAPEELAIDWSRPARSIHDLVRVGGAWTTHRGKRLKIWRTAVTPDGRLDILEVQPEGKARMPLRDWANGARWSPGDPLGT